MKNKLLIIALILCVNNVVISQITTTKVAEKKEETTTLPYDSLRNFVGKDVKQYIGQELYLKGKSMDFREYGYKGFYKNYKRSAYSSSNIYGCCQTTYSSKYTKLAEKYFKVINVIKHPEAATNKAAYGSTYFLELKEKETGSKAYYKYNTELKHSFPFIVTGFFVKQKELNKDREFIVKGKNWMDDAQPMTEMNTGEPVSFGVGSKWKCIDATIEEEYYTFSLIIENDKGEKIALPFDTRDNKRFVFYANDAEKYKEKFGKEIWNKILNEKVIVGMTEEMVRLSWGKPKKINRSSDRDQWIYDGQYLYFENGKMTSFN